MESWNKPPLPTIMFDHSYLLARGGAGGGEIYLKIKNEQRDIEVVRDRQM